MEKEERGRKKPKKEEKKNADFFVFPLLLKLNFVEAEGLFP